MRGLAVVLAGVIAVTAAAQEPKRDEPAKKPQWQRMLTGEDAKKVEKLEERIVELEATDDYEEAIKSAEELLALRRKLQGDDHYEVVNKKFQIEALKRIASLEAKARREWRQTTRKWRLAEELNRTAKYADALTIRRQILEVHRKVLGEEHPATATNYNNVAFNLSALGRAAEAQPLYQKALEITRKVLGEDHPTTAQCYNNAAMNLNTLGKAAEARSLLLKALAVKRAVLGEEHPSTAQGHNNVAMNLAALGKAAEAEPFFRKALDIQRKVLGEDHAETAYAYNNVAANLDTLGKAEEALPLARKALDIRRQVMGENHPITGLSYSNVGMNLVSLGKAEEAQPFFQKALDILRKSFGDDHPDTALCINNLALNLSTQGKTAEAMPLLIKSLEINRRIFGENHSATAGSYNSLAYNLAVHGKAAEALPLYERALVLCRNLLGDNHPETARVYNNLASNLEKLGRTEEAQRLYQKTLEIHRKLHGEDHPATVTSYNNVATRLSARGNEDDAHRLLQKSLTSNRKVLGDAHPNTTASFYNLALNLLALEKTTEAEAILRQAIFSAESSRLYRAKGIERAIGEKDNPRLLLAIIEQRTAPAAAWAHVEATLARGLLDQQDRAASNLNSEASAELARLQDRLADRQSQILKLVSQSNRSESEAARLEQLLTDRRDAEEKLAVLAVAASTRAVASREQIQSAIPADAALLLWVDVSATGGFEEHFACVVRREGEPRWVRLPGAGDNGRWTKEDSLLPGLLRTEHSKASPSQPTIEVLAKKLRTQRIAPVTKALSGVKTLYVVGVEAMAGIPIEVLAPEFTVSYVPSGTFLARLPKKPAFDNTLLAVGDPIYELDTPEAVKLTALPPGGLLIQQLAPGGAAEKAKLLPGDVLLKYADTELKTVDDLKAGIARAVEGKVKEVPVTVWRVDDRNRAGERTVTLPPGPLGAVLAKDPAPQALADRRKTEELFAALRSGEKFNDLPGTRFEVARIAALFEKPTVLLDGRASEAEVDALRTADELRAFRYLHFAAHGRGDDAVAFDSALILSQDKPGEEYAPSGRPWRDNRVTAREVLDFWKLNADLVTLSACETAVGTPGGGDGLLGFAQAFLTAGSRSVCLSLWEVDDTATALLMQRFYQNLLGKRDGLKQPMPKAAALKEAKEWLKNLSSEEAVAAGAKLTDGVVRGGRKEVTGKVVGTPPKPAAQGEKPYAHPQFWAAFVLVGDPD